MAPNAANPRVHGTLLAAPINHFAECDLAMSFVDASANILGVPYPVVKRATRKLLGLLRNHAAASDLQTMITVCEDLAELDPGDQTAGHLARLRNGVRRLTTGARATRASLQDTGLGHDDVAFVSAFAKHLREQLGEPITTRLIDSVPGLKAMSRWPLQPHKLPPQKAAEDAAEQEFGGPGSQPESYDPTRPEPPRMS